MNVHHRRMIKLTGIVASLVLAFGALFGLVNHCGVPNGLYFAVTTVTSTGYGDVTAHGWAAHLVALAIMILVLPLWGAVFALLTTGFTVGHMDSQRTTEDDRGQARPGTDTEILAAIDDLRTQISLMLRTGLPGPAPAAAGGRAVGEAAPAAPQPNRSNPMAEIPDLPSTTDDELDNWFSYHQPTPGQPGQYQEIRDAGHDLASMVTRHCPRSHERDQALDKIREAVMWANAAIACGQQT